MTATRELIRQLGAELRLATRALQEHDESARDPQRDVPAVIGCE